MAAHEWLCSKGLDERLSCSHCSRTRSPTTPNESGLPPPLLTPSSPNTPSPWPKACSAESTGPSCRAAAAHVRGIWFETPEDLEVAVDLYREDHARWRTRSALEDLGRVRVGSGDTQSAVKSFEEALTVTTRVGAEWDSVRIRGRLRRLGVRPRYAVNTRPKTGWAALTEPEINVARLAAEGRTNRQIAAALFVSPHTVNTHLRHVFEKLGINSRVQLTRFVQDQASDSVARLDLISASCSVRRSTMLRMRSRSQALRSLLPAPDCEGHGGRRERCEGSGWPRVPEPGGRCVRAGRRRLQQCAR